MTDDLPKDWIIRIGDGFNFKSSSKKNLWGMNSKNVNVMRFLKSVKKGDHLWFVPGKSKGKIIALAIFEKQAQRIMGPLLNLTETNEELGWKGSDEDWDTEIHYSNLYNLTDCDLITEIQSPCVVRLYTCSNCKLNLPEEFKYIEKYSKIKREMV